MTLEMKADPDRGGAVWFADPGLLDALEACPAMLPRRFRLGLDRAGRERSRNRQHPGRVAAVRPAGARGHRAELLRRGRALHEQLPGRAALPGPGQRAGGAGPAARLRVHLPDGADPGAAAAAGPEGVVPAVPGGGAAMTMPPVVGPELQELLYLRQFFYQCPAGLFETDDAGLVHMVNPAAVRLLAPVIGGGDLSQLFPLLRRVAPELVDVIARDPGRLGPLAAGRRLLIPAGGGRGARLEMQAVRVAPGRVMIVVQDVSAERRLAIREHQTAVELQLAMLGHADEVPGLPVGVTYRAAAAELQVGGDVYGVVGLDDGRVVLVVGDAVGHNLSATTAMGQLRSAIRATAPYAPEPAALLSRADVLAGQITGAECATAACALLDPATGA